MSSDILDRYVPPGLPLVLAALATIAVFMFGLPFALGMWTKISPVPPFLIRRDIHIDPARDQFRVYRAKKLEITRPLSQLHTTTVEEHPKAYKEQMKGKVGVYSKQFMLFGWFGMGGGEGAAVRAVGVAVPELADRGAESDRAREGDGGQDRRSGGGRQACGRAAGLRRQDAPGG